jgi:hypothetical protein
MTNDEKSDVPNADVILRVSGPPKRDFRVHKLILSLASPVFRDMFSLPQQTTSTSEDSNAIDVVQVTDQPHALAIVLKMIYPNPSPPLKTLDTLVECLVIADKYEMQGPMSQLRDALSQVNSPLRVYATASRFGFSDLAASTFRDILTSVDLVGITQLPDDFKFIPATAYHILVKNRAHYLEAAVEVIKQTPPLPTCGDCRGGRFTEEVFRLRLAHLIMKGTPLEAPSCIGAWIKTYGLNSECDGDCVAKFIRIAITRVRKSLADPGTESPQRRKSILKKA